MTAQATTAYQQIERDPALRYLVVGDLHGRFNTLNDLLHKADYVPEKDVLLSVGDLIDRGPRSVELIDFFAAPQRYAIRGNHEQMVLDLANWHDVWSYPHNGGPATNRSLFANNKDINWLQQQVCGYPVCLDIGNDDDPNAFRLVHAEQPFDWSEHKFQSLLHNTSYLQADECRMLWGRNNIEMVLYGITPKLHPQRSPTRCFCGHTPIHQIIEAHNTYWIDTFEADTLSCIDAVTLEQWSVPVQDDEFPA